LNPGTPASASAPSRDLRALLWSSIDNDNSRDLDQVEYAEKLADDSIKLLVGIADVDAFVPAQSAIDQHAASETTSVYPGPVVFPMLPDALSTDRTSLVDAQDRVAIIIEMRVQATGEVSCHDIYQASLRNHAKLAYNATGAWLEGTGPIPAAIARVPGMEAQLRLQLETSRRLRAVRKANGALTFSSIEATTIIENGRVTDLVLDQHNAAKDIIESFMVGANVAMAQHLKTHRSLSIRRVVRVPKRWDRIQAIAARFGAKLPVQPDPRALSEFLVQRHDTDPLHFPDLSLDIVKMLGPGEYIVEHPGAEHEGHFGLAVQDYTHSTAPNRRFADLVTQRLLKATMSGAASPYQEKELAEIAAHCTERAEAGRKVERLMRKIIAAKLLRHQIGAIFDGVVTGASSKGTFVRLLKFPAEGMVVKGARGLDVGDQTRVKLLEADAERGFIDFEKV
jgi:VacB/RNase II family 3'-5' exoribonuclease